MKDIEKEEIKQEVRYLSNKPKIKSLVDNVGIEHILKYLIEDIDSLDIDSDYDMWKFRVADSLEDAYDHYSNRFNLREIDAEDQKSTV
jgi:hypothetical protein